MAKSRALRIKMRLNRCHRLKIPSGVPFRLRLPKIYLIEVQMTDILMKQSKLSIKQLNSILIEYVKLQIKGEPVDEKAPLFEDGIVMYSI